MTPYEKDPFTVPLPEKLDLIRSGENEVKKSDRVFSSSDQLVFRSQDKYFASTEGSSIQQLYLVTTGGVNATAVDTARAVSKSRRYSAPPSTAGYELVP